jgi:hypothetical protein
VLVAHACNPSYSGGRDQEGHGSKPAWANISRDPISKKPFTKKGWQNGPSGGEYLPSKCEVLSSKVCSYFTSVKGGLAAKPGQR